MKKTPTTRQKASQPSGKARRTRSAIVTAAAELMAGGSTPSVAEIAEAADVSRRTVYMYFPTLEQLLIDGTLHTIAQTTVDAVIDVDDDDESPEDSVERMARAIQRSAAETEQQGRALMRLTADRNAHDRSSAPPRGYRRVEWIERSLATVRPRLTTRQFERLVSALTMVVGWEALIVLRDIRASSLKDAEDVSAWAARALVKAALDELPSSTRAKRPRAPRSR